MSAAPPAAPSPFLPPKIRWYRSPVPRDRLLTWVRRSDLRGLAQAGGHFGLMVLTGTLAWWCGGHLPWYATAAALLLHGTVCAFCSNAEHELIHGTVFRTGWLNGFFLRLFAFVGWKNFEIFRQSHTRHHRYTLHPPDDLEVVLPKRLLRRAYLRRAIIDPPLLWHWVREAWRVAGGHFDHAWFDTVCAEGTEPRRRAIRWARVLLAGHGLILIGSLATGQWWLPIIVSATPAYGAWLFLACNETQHIGLAEHQSDFRLCTRTFTVNPLVQFLYWHMNYHIEHHMYPAVPCYRLAELHRTIRPDLPPCPHGLLATWREITAITDRQVIDPTYTYLPPLPERHGSA